MPWVVALLAAMAVTGLLSGCGGVAPTQTPEATATPALTPTLGPDSTMAPTATATFPAIPPAWPFVFNGKATAGGKPVPAGLLITGRIAEYRSAPVTTFKGGYQALPVGPLDPRFFDRPIIFELTRPSDGKTVAAEQTLVFRALKEPSLYELDLTFPTLD